MIEREGFEGFDRSSLDFLNDDNYRMVQRNLKEIASVNPPNPLYIGKRVAELHTILHPYGYFLKALTALGLVLRTAYGYMYGYRNATKELPAAAVVAMMNRRLTITPSPKQGNLGEWTRPIAEFPPPKSGTPETYATWVEQIVARRPKRMTGTLAHSLPKSPEEALLECCRLLKAIDKRLPPHPGTRTKFARRLIGVTMQYFDLKPEKFVPVEIPRAPRTRRGTAEF